MNLEITLEDLISYYASFKDDWDILVFKAYENSCVVNLRGGRKESVHIEYGWKKMAQGHVLEGRGKTFREALLELTQKIQGKKIAKPLWDNIAHFDATGDDSLLKWEYYEVPSFALFYCNLKAKR